jgi:hypothetical protein
MKTISLSPLILVTQHSYGYALILLLRLYLGHFLENILSPMVVMIIASMLMDKGTNNGYRQLTLYKLST